jgi:hypothetical protein
VPELIEKLPATERVVDAGFVAVIVAVNVAAEF